MSQGTRKTRWWHQHSEAIYNSWNHHRHRRIILKLIDKIWFSFLNTKTWFPRRLIVVGPVADWWQHLRVWVPWSWAARVPGARVISVIKGSGSGHDDDSAAPAGGRTNNGLYSLLYSLPWFCLTGPAERSGTICSRPCHVCVLRPVDHLGGGNMNCVIPAVNSSRFKCFSRHLASLWQFLYLCWRTY